MKEGLFIAAITSPDAIPNESQKISYLLQHGDADIVHIRKPQWTIELTAQLINAIPEVLHPKLKLHDHFDLLEQYNLAGVHLNRRNPTPHPKAKSVSRSCHCIEQLEESAHYDYITLSPIFDSISKAGYRSAFDLEKLKSHLIGRKVVALGGVTPSKFPILKQTGFFGAAMLGYFWE